MGKVKKGRRGGKDSESDSEGEVEVVDKTISKKSKGENKKKDYDDEGDLNAKSVKKAKGKKLNDSLTDDEMNENNKKKSKTKGKKKADPEDSEPESVAVSQVQKSFALLEVESDNDDKPINAQLDSEEDKPIKKETGKKSKKARRKRDDSDDDLDQVLAELEMEYSGTKPAIEQETTPIIDEAPEPKAKIKKEKKPQKAIENDVEDDNEVTSTMKTTAQKKKEKKEREKQKKIEDKQLARSKLEAKQATETDAVEVEAPIEEQADEGERDSKKKKKKGAKVEEKDDKKDAKKGPGKKTIAAMQEALKKMREEQERLEREEEERIKREEEAEQERLETLRLEKEKKEKKKQKEKEKRERLKAEGKLLTAKQKADRARAQAMIDNLKAQGLELPDVGERKPRLGTRIKPSKLKTQKSTENQKEAEEPKMESAPVETKVEVEIVEQVAVKESEDEVKDAWDADSSDDGGSDEVAAPTAKVIEKEIKVEKREESEEEDESSEDENESENDEDSSSSEDDSEETDNRTDAEKRRDRAKQRIEQRQIDAEKNRTPDNLRAAVVCVLGHVDTGKTKILDKLRRTNVQDGEAGGITQQIGATNVPLDAIKEQIKYVKGFADMKFKLPGLLIIDTPGHESFSNLRSRGSSLCDFAILVVDIMHGLEPQTIESLNLLKSKKTPFVVALNKVDRLYDWKTMGRRDISDVIANQAGNTQLEFTQRTQEVIVQFAEQGLNAALCYENPDERSYVSLVPTSAVTGEGMGNLLSLIVENCQNRLTKRLMYSEELQATVLEVKAIPGLGTTIDAILINGTLRESDTMVLAGTDGPITTQIRSLLMPQPMKELRVKNAYVEYKEIKAAQGVKIAAKELEKAIAGLNLYIAQKPDEVDIMRENVAKELKTALSAIKLQERGVYVQASTLGSLEALLEFLRASKIPYSGIRIGPVVKKDVMKASIMLEHESQYATILAFDVKIERDAQELADNLGVKIFQADIIYHLFDKFMAYREELKQKKREEFKHIAVFPCKLRILPQFVFNSRDPIVVGVMIEGGIVKEGTPICVPSKEFVDVGIVTSIEVNHKNVESARKGMEVCIKIEPIPGESPKMFGRHFDEKDFLISKISRQSIDACKDYFRDDLTKQDWQLMVELKKLFQIL
ncbi:eukaryotic translation initiation factor 5B isoform X2 [Photinus pyralis]|uniref:eukaryotic translation initiation factor 5B isoform X2 n=1 Tax=Photinus pyralis TaxID=7054 RepID=UPI0012670C44|nr:eukaryotic translation initiation factor 5B isoform X2 [Photinus pyralis]